MANDDQTREGGCACGAVRFTARGEPLRVGLCHCLTCRKSHASAFNAFAIYSASQVEIRGESEAWRSSPSYDRHFCLKCGSGVFGRDGEEVELSVGSFDTPGLFEPEYELWIGRREPWLAPLEVRQYDTNRS
jgi:hypothetical protein